MRFWKIGKVSCGLKLAEALPGLILVRGNFGCIHLKTQKSIVILNQDNAGDFGLSQIQVYSGSIRRPESSSFTG